MCICGENLSQFSFFSKRWTRRPKEKSGETWGEWYALALFPIALGFCLYSLNIFLWRTDQIKARIPARWDDPIGPMILGSSIVLILFINFITKLYEIAKYEMRSGEL